MWRFWIDVGGTFTDCVGCDPDGQLHTFKTLSSGRVKGQITGLRPEMRGCWISDPLRRSGPQNFWKGWTFTLLDRHGDAVHHALILESDATTGELLLDANPTQLSAGSTYELSSEFEAPIICVRWLLGITPDESPPLIEMRLGTTRGTNALLERKGARTAFATTTGFGDLLSIGSQERPDLFSLTIHKPQPLADRVLEVKERLSASGEVLKPLEEADLLAQLQSLRLEGYESLAICLLHAYRNPVHEERVEALARQAGFEHIRRSSAVAPVIKFVPRAETTVLDAYLTPILARYIQTIRRQLAPQSRFKLMTSTGGLVDANSFSGKDSILSGPAGGVIGYARVAERAHALPAIGFDMGGTSTDVSRFAGDFELEPETRKAGVRLAVPTLAIETVAAGGGSLCQFDGVQLHVGPESAGADPGPACYGRGGPLTLTDVNLALGRLLPSQFPFPLDEAAVSAKLEHLCEAIRQSPLGTSYTPQQLALGFVDIANEHMVRAIRRISVQKGFDPASHTLVCFGGAGGLHACGLARQLKIPRILIHPFAGILSAYGIGLADVQRQSEFTVLEPLSTETLQRLDQQLQPIESQLRDDVRREGIDPRHLRSPRRIVELRYRGVESTLAISWVCEDATQLRSDYETLHQQYYGYCHTQRAVEIVSVRTVLTGHTPEPAAPEHPLSRRAPVASFPHEVYFTDHPQAVPVYLRSDLGPGDEFIGPAIICEATSTILIEPDFHLFVNGRHEFELTWQPDPGTASPQKHVANTADEPDPVLLELFNNRFASIAEQMGVTLQKTSVSTNVKERLDYSCAVFDASGQLIVNAPHIPVHLGAMSETVRGLIEDNPLMNPGDVYITNDPYRGGSHLPDVTVVTPVHDAATRELLFFTASRAHHAEIGGTAPGSMPPFSRNLGEEGVLLRNIKLVDGQHPDSHAGFEELERLLRGGPYPSRNPADNLADVTAQVAANRMGATLLRELMASPPGPQTCSGRDIVLAYMGHIRQAATLKMQRALRNLVQKRTGSESGQLQLNFTDHLDSGSPIHVTLDMTADHVRIDFTGTGPVLSSNLNANRAIVTAAVMYVFRCLIEESIPLNSGVLTPLEIVLPECLLNPPAHENPQQCAAMVGGNVETSQRIVDVLLGALQVAAASQGTMNNLTFGNDSFGYYETICGGAGATANGPGANAVHTHMTNTRLTDVEIIEHRYPLLIRRFEIRRDSGGAGAHRGGDGIVREFEFHQPLTVSLLTQRRGPYPPFGLNGGKAGALGKNWVQRAGMTNWEAVPGAVRLDLMPGDALKIETPGGGGWGNTATNS